MEILLFLQLAFFKSLELARGRHKASSASTEFSNWLQGQENDLHH